MDKPLFELNNQQRACLGLAPVESHWELIQLTPSPYDQVLIKVVVPRLVIDGIRGVNIIFATSSASSR